MKTMTNVIIVEKRKRLKKPFTASEETIDVKDLKCEKRDA